MENINFMERKNATVIKGQKYEVLPELKITHKKSYDEIADEVAKETDEKLKANIEQMTKEYNDALCECRETLKEVLSIR